MSLYFTSKLECHILSQRICSSFRRSFSTSDILLAIYVTKLGYKDIGILSITFAKVDKVSYFNEKRLMKQGKASGTNLNRR